ncbi:MAG: LacI family DNA-binding transcriptional regulator [Candidatus Merdivicinus sp.]|jgi:LacI family transcriptional regulator
MAATIKDVAEKAGLGLATVSKYLNGGNVRPKNREAIEQAIAELDFTLNEYARGLKTRRSHTIGIIIPELSNLFITSIITVMEDILRQKGYGTLVCDCRTNAELEEEAVSFLMSKMVDGIVVMPVSQNGEFLRPALERGIPIVLIDRLLPDLEGRADMVLVDNEEAAYQSIRKLMELEHRNIGIVVGPSGVYTSEARLRGYLRAFGEKLPLEGKLVAHADYTVQGGYQAVKQLILEQPEMTALFVTNYEMTLGAILAANELQIRIPDQLSLVGFDNMELAGIISPQLTIVIQPLEAIGREAGQLLISRLEGQDFPAKQVILTTCLQEGESTALFRG